MALTAPDRNAFNKSRLESGWTYGGVPNKRVSYFDQAGYDAALGAYNTEQAGGNLTLAQLQMERPKNFGLTSDNSDLNSYLDRVYKYQGIDGVNSELSDTYKKQVAAGRSGTRLDTVKSLGGIYENATETDGGYQLHKPVVKEQGGLHGFMSKVGKGIGSVMRPIVDDVIRPLDRKIGFSETIAKGADELRGFGDEYTDDAIKIGGAVVGGLGVMGAAGAMGGAGAATGGGTAATGGAGAAAGGGMGMTAAAGMPAYAGQIASAQALAGGATAGGGILSGIKSAGSKVLNGITGGGTGAGGGIGGGGGMSGFVDKMSQGNRALQLGGSLASIYDSYQGQQDAQDQQNWLRQQAAASDPFGPQRAQYAQELSNINADPSSYLQSGEVSAIRDEMRNSLERRAAATGHYYGGGLDEVMAKSEGALMSEMLRARRGELANWAGAGMSPNAGFAGATNDATNTTTQGRSQTISDIFGAGQTIYDIFS